MNPQIVQRFGIDTIHYLAVAVDLDAYVASVNSKIDMEIEVLEVDSNDYGVVLEPTKDKAIVVLLYDDATMQKLD